MKHNKLATIILILIVLGFSSCKKILDIINGIPGQDNDKSCRLIDILDIHDDVFNHLIFHYNIAGDPTLVTMAAGGNQEMDTTNYHFRYDTQGRLSDYIITDRDNRYIFWHKYGHEGNVIIRDTLFESGGIGSGIDTADRPDQRANDFFGVITYTLEYDDSGRVVKEFGEYTSPPAEEFPGVNLYREYNYDENGNRVGSVMNPPIYDDKVSFLRTNDIWMFVNRNYSKNNERPALSYNDQDLPLVFEPEHRAYSIEFLGTSLYEATIQYECSEN